MNDSYNPYDRIANNTINSTLQTIKLNYNTFSLVLKLHHRHLSSSIVVLCCIKYDICEYNMFNRPFNYSWQYENISYSKRFIVLLVLFEIVQWLWPNVDEASTTVHGMLNTFQPVLILCFVIRSCAFFSFFFSSLFSIYFSLFFRYAAVAFGVYGGGVGESASAGMCASVAKFLIWCHFVISIIIICFTV